MDIVVGLLIPDWFFYFLVPFIVMLLVADRVWQIRGWWRQHTTRRERLRQSRT